MNRNVNLIRNNYSNNKVFLDSSHFFRILRLRYLNHMKKINICQW